LNNAHIFILLLPGDWCICAPSFPFLYKPAYEKTEAILRTGMDRSPSISESPSCLFFDYPMPIPLPVTPVPEFDTRNLSKLSLPKRVPVLS